MLHRPRFLVCGALLAWAAFGAHAQNRPGLWAYRTEVQLPVSEQAQAEHQQRLRAMSPAERKAFERDGGAERPTDAILRSTSSMCRTAADVRRVYLSLPPGLQQRCSPAGVRRIAERTVSVTLQCKGTPPASGEGQFVFDDDVSMKAHIQMRVMEGKTARDLRIETHGKWLGADCNAAMPPQSSASAPASAPDGAARPARPTPTAPAQR